MKTPELPPDWGNDGLTRFIENARENTFAIFDNLKVEYKRLSEIDSVFRIACENLHNSQDWFSAFFMFRSHSSFLGAVRLLLGGQVPEAYACLRLVLENSLYGFHLAKNPVLRETWLRRHENDDAKRQVRNEFKYGHVLQTLKAHDKAEGDVANILYEHTIDYGAHPNEKALSQILKLVEGEGKIEFQTAYLVRGNSTASLIALKRAAQVGVCGLNIFRLVYKERFDLLGITERINRLKCEL